MQRAGDVERDWNARSLGLRSKRAGKQTRRSLGRGSLLKKSKALETGRFGDTRSPINSYGVVPSLAPSRLPPTNGADDDDDSWGEGSEYSDDDMNYPSKSTKDTQQPTYPLPPMSFALVPVQHPGSLGYRTTPPKQAKHTNHLQRKTRAPQMVKPSHSVSVSTETQTNYDFHPQDGTLHYSRRYALPRYDPQYQYIGVQQPASTSSTDDRRVLRDSTLHFNDDKRFAQNYTDDFIKTQLENDIIPDLLIEALDEMYRQQKQHTYQRSNIPDFISEQRQDPSAGYSQERLLANQADRSKTVLDSLIAYVVNQELVDIAQEACSEHVSGYVSEKAAQKELERLTDEVIAETCSDLQKELREEDFLNKTIVEPVISELVIDMATETLLRHDAYADLAELKQLTEDANTKLMDSVLLDIMLQQIMKQERIHLSNLPSDNFALDGMMLDILLRRMTDIELSRSEPTSIKPISRYHERVVTDVVMELLLNELCLGLDEDMNDFDEYETGLSDYLLLAGQSDGPSTVQPSPTPIFPALRQ